MNHMIIFPMDGFLDELACYNFLLEALHPDGLVCPNGHALPSGQGPHDRHRWPVLDYRCRECGSVFNLFTSTVLTGSRYRCSTWVLILRGIAQGTPTAHLANELGLDRSNLLERRHQLQALVFERFSPLRASKRDRGGIRRTLSERGRKGCASP